MSVCVGGGAVCQFVSVLVHVSVHVNIWNGIMSRVAVSVSAALKLL